MSIKTKKPKNIGLQKASTVATHFTARLLDVEERIGLATRILEGLRTKEAEEQLLEWRTLKPFQEGGEFSERVARMGMDEAKIHDALESAHHDESLLEIPETINGLISELLSNLISTDASDVDGWSGMLSLVDPMLRRVHDLIREKIDELHGKHPAIFDDASTVARCAKARLGESINPFLVRTCILEMHVAKLQGELSGQDPKQRYESFLRMMVRPDYRRVFFREYQGLARLIATRAAFWLVNTSEWLERLANDHDSIVRMLIDKSPIGGLRGWSESGGDSHNGGRSVIIMEFEHGNRVVYKPRSVSVERAFAGFIGWFNRASRANLRAVRVLEGDSYGWCEYIRNSELGDGAQAGKKYFQKQGEFLAIFYALGTSDLHHENIIAAGEDPVYVDLETMFHTPCRSTNAQHGDVSMDQTWPYIVSDTMLLPGPTMVGANDRTADLSAFGAPEEFDWPLEVDKIENEESDEIRIIRGFATVNATSHQARINGKPLDVASHLDDIRSGFTRAYRFLCSKRGYLASDDGLRAMFAAVRLRQVIRPTASYGHLLQASLHPDYQRDWMERRLIFERIWPQKGFSPWLKRIADTEIKNLLQHDVPLFQKTFEGTSLFSAEGEEFNEFFVQSAAEFAEHQLRQLGEEDLACQLRILDACFRSPQSRAAIRPTECAKSEMDLHDGMVGMADQIAQMLAETAREEAGSSYWICQTAGVQDAPVLSPGLLSVYDGQLGIALFLAAHASITGNADSERLARKSLDTVRRWAGSDLRGLGGIGVMEGAAGLSYVLANVGALWNERKLIDAAFESLAAPSNSVVDSKFDVTAGSAGVVLMLSGMRSFATRKEHHQILQTLARRRVNEIVKNASQMTGSGVGWQSIGPNSTPLAGFSHGVAGIALALAHAARWLRRPDLDRMASNALAYERDCFCPTSENWRDFRPSKNRDAHAIAWCHGAPGIALGRHGLRQAAMRDGRLRDKGFIRWEECNDIRRDIEIAITTTWSRGFATGNHSLCHGMLGNLSILDEIARATDDQVALARIRTTLVSILRHASEGGWAAGDVLLCKGATLHYAPGLMTGAAGIGYALLRFTLRGHALPQVLHLGFVDSAPIRG